MCVGDSFLTKLCYFCVFFLVIMGATGLQRGHYGAVPESLVRGNLRTKTPLPVQTCFPGGVMFP